MYMPVRPIGPHLVRGDDARPVDHRDAPQAGQHIDLRSLSGAQASR